MPSSSRQSMATSSFPSECYSQDTTGSHQLLVDVKDSGVGIPQDQIERIFERFFQVKEGDNQNVGAGIGLALSKELAEFLGGSLSVVSSPSAGSTFTLTLPVEVVKIEENVNVNSSMPTSLTLQEEFTEDNIKVNGVDAKPLLLIVEDHIDLRKFICLCLGDEYEYLEAEMARRDCNWQSSNCHHSF